MATARDRKLIAGHALRPEETDALLAAQAGAPAGQAAAPATRQDDDADRSLT